MTNRIWLAAASGLAMAWASDALAQSVAFTAPNIVSQPDPVSVSLNGSTFVNSGLVGTMRLPADLHDFNGETLGSFSSLAIDLTTWRKTASGYTASMFTLPDRGPNNIGGFTTTNYAARLNKFTVSFNPYTGAAALASNVQQGTLTQSGGFLLRDETGQTFTGRDPQAGVIVRNGISYPTPPAADAGAGKIALDAEGLTFLRDGSFYVSDEYGAMVLYFDATGKQIGAIQANPDLLPRVNGQVNFNGTNDAPLVPGSTGRRSNQGLEGVSVSPDGKRLFVVLQSATLQDNPTNVAVRRNNTRVLVYDISANKTPTTPMAEYVLQLPVYNNSATGTGAASATAAQSEILALNNSQFLVLSRDGNGRGTNGNANQIAFKSILLVDTAGATNIAGTPFSTGTQPVSTTAASNGSGALVSSIVPVQQVELVNILNSAQLGKFGVNLNTKPSTQFTLSEKWEAMGLAPVLEEGKPHDFFLFIGNDNDFVSHDVDAAGVQNADTSLNSAAAGVGDNDNVIMVYRLTLPTYIDPQALAALQATAPYAMAGARVTAARLGVSPLTASSQNLGVLRRARQAGVAIDGVRGWGQAAYDRVARPGDIGRVDAGSFTAGVDAGDSSFRYGAVVSATTYNGDADQGFDVDGESYSGGLYVSYFAQSGLYVQGAISIADENLDVSRPAAYAQIAEGHADGRVYGADFEVGYMFEMAGGRIGPFADGLYSDVKLDSYRESGASVSNGQIPTDRYKRFEGTIGVEATFNGWGSVRPTARLGYTFVSESGDKEANLMLADLPNSADIIRLPKYDDGFVGGEAALEGEWSGFGWRVALGARATDGDTSGQASIGIWKRF